MGLWHGLISPITFVVLLFVNGVDVYEVIECRPPEAGSTFQFGSGSGFHGGFVLGDDTVRINLDEADTVLCIFTNTDVGGNCIEPALAGFGATLTVPT